jgi:hypothetical protein
VGTLFSAGFSMLGINQKMGVVDPVAFDDFTKVIQELICNDRCQGAA